MGAHCSECGALLENGKSCREYFDRMIAWDFEDYTGAGSVHHLTVLCYYLQHPSLYSKEALVQAKKFLREIIEKDLSGQELLEKNRDFLAVKERDWSIKGTAENHGVYAAKFKWSMAADDVMQGGIEQYPERVKTWAESIYQDLKKNDEIA